MECIYTHNHEDQKRKSPYKYICCQQLCILTANVLVKPFLQSAWQLQYNKDLICRLFYAVRSVHPKLYSMQKHVSIQQASAFLQVYLRHMMNAHNRNFQEVVQSETQWLAAQTSAGWTVTLRNTERPQQRSGDLQCKFLFYSCLYRTSVGWSM